MKLKILRVIIIGLSIFFAAERFGLIGIASVLIVAAVSVAPIEIYVTLRMMNAPVRRCIWNLIHPFLGCMAMAIILFQISEIVDFPNAVTEFVSLLLLGVLAYSAYIKIATRFLGYGIGDDLAAVAGLLDPTG